jgi:hypothetical protein
MARRRVRRAWPLAVLLVVLTTGSATALTWSGNRALTASGGGSSYRGGLAVSSSTLVHAVYEQYTLGAFRTWYRRSTNSGTTWGTPILLSRPSVGEAGVPAIDASGSAVDAVWIEGDDIVRGLNSTVIYRRSTDGGLTWLDPIQLSATLGSAGFPRVLHAASGRVLVTWTDAVSGSIYVRVSTNGGATFAAASLLGTTTSKPFAGGLRDAFPVLAQGSGIVYVAYFAGPHSLRVRRSTNLGASWTTYTTISTTGDGFEAPGIAAVGSTVVVGYGTVTSADEWTVIRRSTDKGAHWSSPVAISPASGTRSFSPVLTYRSGAFRLVFERCGTSSCSSSDTWYRASTTGSTWTTATKASSRHRTYDYPADVDVATKVLVLYNDVNSSAADTYVRQGS